MRLALRLNAVNAVMPEDISAYKKSKLLTSKYPGYLKLYSTKSCEAFRAIFPRKSWIADRGWNSNLIVVALLVH